MLRPKAEEMDSLMRGATFPPNRVLKIKILTGNKARGGNLCPRL
jgi:hypothetical protein